MIWGQYYGPWNLVSKSFSTCTKDFWYMRLRRVRGDRRYPALKDLLKSVGPWLTSCLDSILPFINALQWRPKWETTAMCGCIFKLIWRQNEMTNLCAKEIWLGAKAGGGGGGPTWSALIIELFKCRNFHRGSREGNNHNVELESRSDSSACCSQVEE